MGRIRFGGILGDMHPQLQAIEATHGVFLRSEILALGYRDEHITRFTRRGIWIRVRRGAFVSGETWRAASEADRYRIFCSAALRQARTLVVASHTSAVAFHDGPLWGLDLDISHLTRTDGRTGRKEAHIQQHRGAIAEGDVMAHGPFQVMTPTRTALELTTVAPLDPCLCVMNDFLHRKLTTQEALEQRYATMHHWPESLKGDIVLRLADPRIESVGETRTFLVIWREGLPAPEPQYEIFDEYGNLVARVDFAWPEHGIFLEFDGREKYLQYRREGESVHDAILREKRREELICQITGWRCIRVVWADLERPGVLGMRLRNLFAISTTVA